MPKLAWTGETLWVDGASSSFNCYGSIKHRLDVPGDLEPETVRGWLA